MMQLLLHHRHAYNSAPKALHQYFKPVSKSLLHPAGQLSKTFPSTTIKDPIEAGCAGLFKITEEFDNCNSFEIYKL